MKWKEHLSQQQEERCHRQCKQKQADQKRIEKIGVWYLVSCEKRHPNQGTTGRIYLTKEEVVWN
jgi:hypothetical protein